VNKQREKWWIENKDSLFSKDKMDFCKVWDAAIESTKESQFGCHIGCGNPYPDCVLDTGDIAECETAMDLNRLGKTKEDCQYWKEIEG